MALVVEAAESAAFGRGLPAWVGAVVEKLVLWAMIGESRKVRALYEYFVLGERPSDIAAKYGTDPKTFRRSWLRRLEDAVPLPTGVKYVALGDVVARAAPRAWGIPPLFEGGECLACGRYIGDSPLAKAAHVAHAHTDLLIENVSRVLNQAF